jgi:hypothetical protein
VKRPAVVASFLLLWAGPGLVACTSVRADGDRGVPTRGAEGVTAAKFALVVEGMRPIEVADLLGSPVRRTSSLAEGLAWPEPKDTCWYYPSVDRRREYQVCFVTGRLMTRGSYMVTGEGAG